MTGKTGTLGCAVVICGHGCWKRFSRNDPSCGNSRRKGWYSGIESMLKVFDVYHWTYDYSWSGPILQGFIDGRKSCNSKIEAL